MIIDPSPTFVLTVLCPPGHTECKLVSKIIGDGPLTVAELESPVKALPPTGGEGYLRDVQAGAANF
jgi:hypothetical protein